jgi:O-antigen/teichoic acid export membrane protein
MAADVMKKPAEGVTEWLRDDGAGPVVARGAAEAFVINMVGAGLALICNVLLARMLGADEYGFYIYALGWMLILAFGGKFGLESASIRYVAAYHANREWGLLRGYLGWSLRTAAVSSVAIALVGFAIVALLWGHATEKELHFYLVTFLLLPFTVLLLIRSAALQGFKKVVMAQAPNSVLLPVVIVGGVFASWLAHDGKVGAMEAMTVHLGATIIAFLVVFYFVRVNRPPEVVNTAPEYCKGEWIKTAFSLLAISGFFVVIQQTDIIIVGLFHGATYSGIYAAANKVASFVASGLMVVNIIVAPMISQLHATGDTYELKRVLRMAAIFGFVIAIPVAVSVFLFGGWIMELFGPRFSEGYVALLILTLGQMVNALAGAVGFFMTMTGNEKVMAWIAGCCATLNLMFNFILIPPFGIEGAAASTACTVVIWNVGLAVYIYRRFGIHVSVLSLVGK